MAWNTIVSVQHKGRYPGLYIIASAVFPVAQWLIGRHSLITVTSSYRICTCFPFHRSQLHIACHKSDSNACLLRHLYATYSVSSCVAYTIAWIIILQLVTLFNRFLSDALQTHLQKRCKKLQNTLQQPACKWDIICAFLIHLLWNRKRLYRILFYFWRFKCFRLTYLKHVQLNSCKENEKEKTWKRN